ncbi:MAG: HEAT repeat domain-containing protein [Elusimicrobiota bacterium]
MKWFLLLLIFIAGVYYLSNQRKVEVRQKVLVEQIKKNTIKTTIEPLLPFKPQKAYVMKFSMQTLTTLRTLTYDPNYKVRAAAAELLWQLQDEQIPAIIKHMFQEEPEESVRKSLITFLVNDKSKLSLALLSEAMNSYDKATRLNAVEAIGTFTSREAILVLNKGLEDYDEDIRLKSLEAVNQIRRNIEAHKEQELRELGESKPLFRIE